jgi:hypothetical protein
MGVQLGGKGHRGRIAGAGRELLAAAEAVAAMSRGGCLVMRLPQSAPGTGSRPAVFVVSAGHRIGLCSRVALPPPVGGEMPARQAGGCVSLEW